MEILSVFPDEYDLLLPCFVKPKSDELFSSWLVRLAYSHYCKSHSFYKLLFPSVNIWNRDIDKLAPEKLIKLLTVKTPYSYDFLFNLTLKSYEGSLYIKHNAYGNNKWILPLGVYHRNRNRFGLVFCPNCLKNDKEEPYYRKHWRISFSVICTTCGVFLHEKCPNCKKPVIFFRNDLGNRNKFPDESISHCFYCNFNLADAPIKKVPTDFLIEQQKLFKVSEYGCNQHVIYSHLYFDVLHQIIKILLTNQDPNRLLRIELSKKLKTSQIPNKFIKKRSDFELLPLKYRGILIKQAVWLLDDFPKRFIEIFKKNEFKSTALLKDFNNAPFWYYNVVFENFFISNVNRRF